MYAQFIDVALLDNQVIHVSFEYLGNGQVKVTIPHFWESISLDPNYTMLLGGTFLFAWCFFLSLLTGFFFSNWKLMQICSGRAAFQSYPLNNENHIWIHPSAFLKIVSFDLCEEAVIIGPVIAGIVIFGIVLGVSIYVTVKKRRSGKRAPKTISTNINF